MGLIKESFQLVATDLDVLAAPSRLAAIPANGKLTIEVSATDSDSVNFGQLTVQLPTGDIPLDTVTIPASGLSTTDAVLDSRTEMIIILDVLKGGHVLIQYVENGTVVVAFFHITLMF